MLSRAGTVKQFIADEGSGQEAAPVEAKMPLRMRAVFALGFAAIGWIALIMLIVGGHGWFKSLLSK